MFPQPPFIGPPARRWWQSRWATPTALLLIVLLGAYFRTIGLYVWDGDYQFHPDESFFTSLSTDVAMPASLGEYFDSYVSPLNPRNRGHGLYVYGLLPVTIVRWMGNVFPSAQPISHVGRTFSVLWDLGSIVMLFFIGRLMHGRRVGLLAALLYACAAMAIQQSHFYTVDTAGVFFVLLALYWIVRVGQGGGWGSYVAVGLSIGGAVVGGRITMATLGLIAGVAALQASFGQRPAPRRVLRLIGDDPTGTGSDWQRDDDAPGSDFWAGLGRFFSYALPRLCVAGFLTLLMFRVFQPDAFVGSRPQTPLPPEVPQLLNSPLRGLGFFDIRLDPRYLDNLQQSAGFASGAIDWPPSVQWANRAAYLFPLQNMVIWGMGVPLGVLAWVAWAAAGWQIVRRRWFAPLALWVWVAFYFVWQGAQFAKTMRYMLPIYGPLILFAAWALVALFERRAESGERRAESGEQQQSEAPLLAPRSSLLAPRSSLLAPRSSLLAPRSSLFRLTLVALVVGSTFAWGYAFSRIYTRPHTRLTASRWILDNVPPGSRIAYEHWDYPLPAHADGRDPWVSFKGTELAPYAEDELTKYTGAYDTNDATKYNYGLLDELDRNDYIVMSSNRVYDSIKQLPMRYPATIRYYRALFDGSLGWELAADVTSYPSLLGIAIPDQSSEEAFTVYDHPRVLVYHKTAAYTRANAERLIISDMNWAEVYKITTVKGGKAPTALRFTPSQWPAYIAGGSWASTFSLENLPQPVAVLLWLVVLELLGLAGFALLFHLLPMLPDRGFTLARVLALLLVAYGAWLLGSAKLLSFTPLSVWLCALPLLAIGAYVAYRSRDELRAFYTKKRGALLSAEALYLGAFALLLVFRLLNPELWHPARGGEKPMDLAYLTATLKSASFPPYDPWFAGGYINYYYFGFVIVGALIHLSGIAPAIAYNLAVPTLFALTALGSWGVAYNLLLAARAGSGERGAGSTRSERRAIGTGLLAARAGSGERGAGSTRSERRAIGTGLLAALFVLILGSLTQAIWYLPGTASAPLIPSAGTSYAAQQVAQGRAEWAFWDATRIIDGTVNEFPFFTFLFADLHAHMIVMPLSLATLCLMVALVRKDEGRRMKEEGIRDAVALERGSLARWVAAVRSFILHPSSFILCALALVTGAMRATNTWDYPTFTGLTLATLALVAWWNYQQGRAGGQALDALLGDWRWPLWLRAVVLFAAQVLLVVGLGYLLFLPFIRSFVTDSSGIEPWRDARTTLWDWLRINGLWLFVLLGAGALLARRYARLSTSAVAVLLGAAAALLAAGLVAKLSAPVLVLPLLGCAVALAWRMRRRSPRLLLPMLWAVTGLALSAGVDFIVVKGDVGRMNTVFKFGLHSWMLFALSAAIVLPALWERARRWQPFGRYAWRAAALALVGAALVYPLTATPARIADRYAPGAPLSLDGLAFMQTVGNGENGRDFPLKPDADAMAWIRQNIAGSPVMLEAHQESYHWGGRVSIYTGLPTLLGWQWHQIQQRSAVDVQPIADARQNAIQQIYASPDLTVTAKLIRDYGVQYIYVGELERALYDQGNQVFGKFDRLAQGGALAKVYDAEGTRIYKVSDSYSAGILTTDLQIVKPKGNTPPPLMLDTPVAELPAVNEYAWNTLVGDSSWASLLLWLVALYALVLLGLPVAALVFGRWRDGGWAWARLIGLLLLGYAVWLPTSLGLWRYNLWGLLGGLLATLVLNACALLWLGRRSNPAPGSNLVVAGARALGDQLRARGRAIVVVEALFLAGFALLVLLRALDPDLWQPYFGGEKPMEFGFLNAILRSPVMPPLDPFFSGGYINYYYYGLYLVSLPIKATGINPAIGFNLVVPTLFGLTFAGAYAIVAQLTGRVRYGLLGAVFLALLGNLASIVSADPPADGAPLLSSLLRPLAPLFTALRDRGPSALLNLSQAAGDSWFWGPSRVIPGTINEFPFWSFLFADLHAHLVALPITLLAIAIAYTIVDRQLSDKSGPSSFNPQPSTFSLLLGALTLGALAVTNSWDFPTYALLIGLALLGRAWRGDGSFAARLPRLFVAALVAVGVGVGGLALYAPFFDKFYALVHGIGRVSEGTPIGYYLVVYGLFLLLLLPALVGAAWRLLHVASRLGRRNGGLGAVVASVAPYVAGAALLVLAIMAFWQPALSLKLLLAALALLGVAMLLSRRTAPATWFSILLATLAWCVSLGTELVFIRDHLAEGDFYRMNTVFKFGVQIGTLLALATVAALPRLLARADRFGNKLSGAVAGGFARGALACALALGLVFPIVGTASRLANRFPNPPGPTLNGLAFLRTARFDYNCEAWGGCQNNAKQVSIDLAPDADAIDWLNKNVRGTPVVLQSSLWFYRAYGVRVAANTGLPTVVSDLHVNEQRDGVAAGMRSGDVGAIYNAPDADTALRLLAKYAVNYVYVGAIERAVYSPAGLQKFDTTLSPYLRVAYQNPGVRIYQVGDIPGALVQPQVSFTPDLPPPPRADGTQPAPVPQTMPQDQPAPQNEQPATDLAGLEDQVRANPQAAGPAFALAQAYRLQNRLDDAANVLLVAADANPGDVPLHQILGDILSDAGRHDEATKAYQQAIDAEPSAGNINKLGSAQLAWGDLDAARETLGKALLTDANAPDPHYFLGQLYMKEGDNASAKTELARYLELAPQGSYSADASKLLGTLN